MSLPYTITTDQFPNGTVVGVYDRSARVNDAAPSGSQITSATSSGTAVAFNGLPDAGGYFVAYAQVGGLPRYATFYVAQAPLLSSETRSGTQAQLTAYLATLAPGTEYIWTLTNGSGGIIDFVGGVA